MKRQKANNCRKKIKKRVTEVFLLWYNNYVCFVCGQDKFVIGWENTVMGELQKPGMWKRISAYIFDAILLVTVAVGVAFLLSVLFRYDAHTAEREALRQSYEREYGVSFDIEAENYEKLTDAEREVLDGAYAAFATDPEVNRIDVLLINLTLLITTFSVLVPFLILEVWIPLAFGHGRTLGKKIFGIAIVRVDCVRISRFQLFVRAILGKYTLETMLPLFLVLLFLINVMPAAAVLGLAILSVAQIATLLFSAQHAPIHDVISGTVAVDFASQMIFDTTEDALAYVQKRHAEAVERADY